MAGAKRGLRMARDDSGAQAGGDKPVIHPPRGESVWLNRQAGNKGQWPFGPVGVYIQAAPGADQGSGVDPSPGDGRMFRTCRTGAAPTTSHHEETLRDIDRLADRRRLRQSTRTIWPRAGSRPFAAIPMRKTEGP